MLALGSVDSTEDLESPTGPMQISLVGINDSKSDTFFKWQLMVDMPLYLQKLTGNSSENEKVYRSMFSRNLKLSIVIFFIFFTYTA